MAINGYDPLEGIVENGQFLGDVAQRSVQNILKSYTGFYDLFAEAIQNALDAVETRKKQLEQADTPYVPQIWVEINLQSKIVRITDNGHGMSEEQFKLCFAPNVSFNKQQNTRGQKGVGATFLAYGFSFVKLQTRRDEKALAAVLRGGRQWAEDRTGQIPRPKFEEVEFCIPELQDGQSGTSIEIRLGDAPGERPRYLDWQGALTATQWFDVLRIKTPLGGVYLSTPPFCPRVSIKVYDGQGHLTQTENTIAQYLYPHDIPNIKVKDLDDIRQKLASIQGDPRTQFRKLPDEYKKLNCVWAIWGPNEILDEKSALRADLTEEERVLINRHSVHMYAAFVDSTKLWDTFNDSVLHLRQDYRILRGGLQMACDYMVQGELITIPLKKAIGYQNTTHVIVHFTDGNPDLGRKTFQPECHDLAVNLAAQAVKTLTRYLSLLRPDTGAVSITPDKELHEWKKAQEGWREQHTINMGSLVSNLGILSEPRQEQDVIALFHELVGAGTIRGLKFFGTEFNDRYDCLFELNYPDDVGIRYNATSCALGVGTIVDLPYTSEPKVLEYKYDFDALIEDFQKDIKFSKHIDLVVCWKASGEYSSMFELKPLLIESNGNDRIYYGATHAAYRSMGGGDLEFEVIILQDLLGFLLNPDTESAKQKTYYAI